MRRIYIWICACVLLTLSAQVSISQNKSILDSGGPLSSEQAAYDVTYYDLDLTIDPEARMIDGALTVRATIVHPVHYFVLDLDTMLAIDAVSENLFSGLSETRNYERVVGEVRVDLQRTRQPGEVVEMRIDYGGNPRVAVNPPWQGGFTWEKTPSDAHWVATSCQGEGADLWWPCKDHVSDEPDSMDLHITVPTPLVAACNGKLIGVDQTADKNTYHWHISQPINIYNVALNIAPYELIEEPYTSVTGEVFDFQFFVLPQDLDKGRKVFPEFRDHMAFYEDLLGPYPFRGDKYGVAQTPHLGMEHQSIIAYGANFDNGSMTGGIDWGYDALHHHELAHEWWGNLVTNASWEDMWIHEGFGSYMQALYCEKIGGREQYFNYMRRIRRFANTRSVAPKSTMTSTEIYKAPIYAKGAWILHSLRYYIGDEAFFESLKRMAYPSDESLKATDGSQCRFVTTEDYLRICEEISGVELDWFFELYLRQPRLPILQVDRSDSKMEVHWEMPVGNKMPFPVEVRVDDDVQSYVIPADGTSLTIEVAEDAQVVFDPYRWILCSVND